MLKSVTGIALRAQSLIVAWDSWRNGSLIDSTSTLNAPRQVLHIRAVQSQAKSYSDVAKALIADPNFAQLDADVQADVKAIAEELDIAIADMEDETDPDKKFATADANAKLDATAGMRVDKSLVERFAARAAGKMRGQVAPKPKPQPPPK